MSMQFSSEGFDLENVTDGNVLELPADVMEQAESFKATGNDHFKNNDWEEAHEWYTKAIEATPGMKGEELLQLEKEWEEEQTKSWREELRKYDEEKSKNGDAEASSSPPERKEKPSFQPPPHPHGDKLAVYYSNRAASSLQIAQELGKTYLESAVEDCKVAVLLRPSYVKAWVRRSTAYERLEDTENALSDATTALELDPSNTKVRQQVGRLQRLEDERLEKLKAETMDKLKDLGNSLLGNFGLSLDNFNAVQDPNTGSYSISFQNS